MSDNSPLIVVFDGDCGICQALRAQAQAWDGAGKLRFVAYQSADLAVLAPGLTRDMARQALYTVGANGRRRGARAFFEIMRHLPGVWGMIGTLGALPALSWLAEPVYRLVARHRAAISRWLGLNQCHST
jgi:predicted DCC family thiol-disulfide oxidoreductase YuxK